MEDNFYGRNQEQTGENTSGSSVYSYSYVNPTPGQENPNETTGYQAGPQQQYQNYYNQPNYNQNSYQNSYHSAGAGNSMGSESTSSKKKSGFGKTLMKTVAIALVFGLVSSAVFANVVTYWGVDFGGSGNIVSYKSSSLQNTADSITSNSGVTEIVESVMASIVAITNTAQTEVQSFFGSQMQQYESAGSGIIIGEDSSQIYLVTNNHVVDGTIDLKVTFSDNETVSAEVKGTDAGTDLAVVTVQKKDLKESTRNTIKVAVMGDSKVCKVGEPVIAIGNALGYGQSVTTGVVSALNRSVTIENISNTLLQTDAAINPGNSGGALLNYKGEVIGINSAKYSDTDVEGIGYAIPISNAQPIIEAIISREAVAESERGYIGIYGSDVTEDIASVYNLPIGVYISDLVEGGAAEKAGLCKGDIITGIEDFEVTSLSELQSQLQYYRAGASVKVKAMVRVDGQFVEKTFTVVLQKNTNN